MTRRERLVTYLRATIDPNYDADQHELGLLLDSVSLIQLITFIDEELGVSLDLPSLRLEMFMNMESLLHTLAEYVPEPLSSDLRANARA